VRRNRNLEEMYIKKSSVIFYLYEVVLRSLNLKKVMDRHFSTHATRENCIQNVGSNPE
jgi:hypothetical protein